MSAATIRTCRHGIVRRSVRIVNTPKCSKRTLQLTFGNRSQAKWTAVNPCCWFIGAQFFLDSTKRG